MLRMQSVSLAAVLLASASVVLAQAPPTPPWGNAPGDPLGLETFERLVDASHPRLGQAALAVEAARGRAEQARKYPNPVFTFSGDELADRTGPAGILTPFFSQEIVTRGKRRLSHAAALREVDHVSLQYFVERLALLTTVRQAYFDVLALQQRVAMLGEAVAGARQTAEDAQKAHEAGQGSKLQRLTLEAAWQSLRAQLQAAEAQLPAAFHRLAAAAGQPDLPMAPLAGNLELPLPEYDLDALIAQIRTTHPQIMAAQVAIDRARLQLELAQAQRKPNVTIGAGYTRQSQNRSNDVSVMVSFPIPLWDRNQGNIRAARAELSSATLGPARIEAELTERVATVYRSYTAARQVAEHIRTEVLPKQREVLELTIEARRLGQADLAAVQAARSELITTQLEYLTNAAEAWKSAAALAGMLLDDAPPPAK